MTGTRKLSTKIVWVKRSVTFTECTLVPVLNLACVENPTEQYVLDCYLQTIPGPMSDLWSSFHFKGTCKLYVALLVLL